MKTIFLILIAILAAPAGAAEQQLNKDQQDACGSILCLAGGGATPECSAYLERFFDTDPKERRNFLNKCPTSGVSRDALGELAAYGQNCASKKLAAYLNRQLCSAQQKTSGYTCPGSSPNAWRICASYYAELTDEQPPKLVRRCRHETDDSGAFGRACHHWWVANDYETGHWCKDQDASCEESDVGTEARSLGYNLTEQAGNR